jgi:hypothetical protein
VRRAEITLDLKQETGVMSALSRVRPDEFTIGMLATVMLAFLLPPQHTSRPSTRARTREATSSASIWTGTRVPRNTGFPPMILPNSERKTTARYDRIGQLSGFNRGRPLRCCAMVLRLSLR